MHLNNVEVITLVIAIWGTIAGTLSLVLRYLDSKKDKPILLPKPRLDFSDLFEPPPIVSMNLEVVNTGHRPTTIDSIWAIYEPNNLIERLTWLIFGHGKLHFAIKDKKNRNEAIQEGHNKIFNFGTDIIFPNENFDPINIKKIIVRDKAGNEWSSHGVSHQDLLLDLRNASLIKNDAFNSENRDFKINYFTVGKHHLITVRRKYYSGSRDHCKWFQYSKDAEIYYEKINNEGKDFVDDKIIAFSFEDGSTENLA